MNDRMVSVVYLLVFASLAVGQAPERRARQEIETSESARLEAELHQSQDRFRQVQESLRDGRAREAGASVESLTKAAEQLFEVDLRHREAQLKKLEARVQRIREELKKKKSQRDQIIREKVAQLVGEANSIIDIRKLRDSKRRLQSSELFESGTMTTPEIVVDDERRRLAQSRDFEGQWGKVPSENEILDILEKHPRYMDVVAELAEYYDLIKQGGSELDDKRLAVFREQIERLEVKRERMFKEMRPRIAEHILRESNVRVEPIYKGDRVRRVRERLKPKTKSDYGALGL